MLTLEKAAVFRFIYIPAIVVGGESQVCLLDGGGDVGQDSRVVRLHQQRGGAGGTKKQEKKRRGREEETST